MIRFLGTQIAMNAQQSPASLPSWRHSVARQLLETDLLNGTIPLTNAEMMPREVYYSRPEYLVYPYKGFPRRLRALRAACHLRLNRSVADTAAFRNDRRFDQRPAQTILSSPRWEGSEAEQWFNHDHITNGLH